MSSILVHKSASIFDDPDTFNPGRWMEKDSKELEQWLVSFSRGPRSCLGINLAWCELYLALATTLRKFDMTLDGSTKENLIWRDCFTPHYYKGHLKIRCQPKSA